MTQGSSSKPIVEASDDKQVEERRDELLRRMLKTPPKPHKSESATAVKPQKDDPKIL